MSLFVALSRDRRAGVVRSTGRVLRPCALAALCATLLLAGLCLAPSPATARPIKAELSAKTREGYLRIMFRFSDDVEANVRLANQIVIVDFKSPVWVAIDRLNEMAPDYVSAARSDPDGQGLRIALARKVKLNATPAGDRLFVDLMPENWSGPPPGLPAEVIKELTRRAREAEKTARKNQRLARQRRIPLTRVRVGHQPTFSRYIFELAKFVPVATSRENNSLTLVFDAPLKFDLADAQAAPPPMIETIATQMREETTAVRFALIGNVDVRTFREEKSYVVDLSIVEPVRPKLEPTADRGATPDHRPPRAPPVGPHQKRFSGAEGLEAPRTVPAAIESGTRPQVGFRAERHPAAPSDRRGAPPPVAPPPVPSAAASPPVIAPPAVAPPAVAPPAVAPPAVAPPAIAPPAVVPPQTPAAGAAEHSADTRPHTPAQPAAEPPSALPPPIVDLELPPDYVSPGASAQADAPAASPPDSGARNVSLSRRGDSLLITFDFTRPTPAAVFQRGDSLWAVFDSGTRIDLAPLQQDPTRTIRSAERVASRDGQAVRIKLARPRLAMLRTDGSALTISIGDAAPDPPSPLVVTRRAGGAKRATAAIPFDDPRTIHRLIDPEAGDTIFVVTALGPPRGFLRSQTFVDFRALASSHGVAIQPFADDLDAELAADKIILMRPGGLSFSAGDPPGRRTGLFRPAAFDPQLWGFDRQADFEERRTKLANAAAEAPETKRTAPRLELARFYLARGLYPEAKGVLDVALNDERPKDDPSGLVMRALAMIMVGRFDDAMRDLSHPIVGDQLEAKVWRALAFARQGKWTEAHKKFRDVETAISGLPIELQRIVLKEAVRASIEVKDFAAAANQLHGLETLGVDRNTEPEIAVLAGRVAEGLGRSGDALAAYRLAAGSKVRPAVAQGRLRETRLRYELGDLNRNDMMAELEELTTMWRGDDTEIEALQVLARLYTEDARYRDAFHVMRTALMAHPNSNMTRRIQEEAAATFDTLFLAGKGDAMPVIDALGLFYDYRELTPIGRRGDEMIRRLADRLVSVDLLDQAAELLQHQVNHRLQGAARAQVAIRLAVVYLMNRKPDHALATLVATRTGDLATELREQRLLIEARALSDTGRPDLALEVVANVNGRAALRLRSDILWTAKRWREAAEQIELLFGDRWRDWQPLTEPERADLLRAAIGYALAQDSLGLGRFRERYAAKMADGPERRAFEVATAPFSASTAEFRTVARTIAAGDTLEGFLRDLHIRYPQTESFSAKPSAGKQSQAPLADSPPTAIVSTPRDDGRSEQDRL